MNRIVHAALGTSSRRIQQLGRLCRPLASLQAGYHAASRNSPQEERKKSRSWHEARQSRNATIKETHEYWPVGLLKARQPYDSGSDETSWQVVDAKTRLAAGTDPFEVLRSAMSRREATVDVMRICLDHRHRELKKIPRLRRVSHTPENEIVAAILEYLRADEDLWVQAFMRDLEAQFLLAYFAVAERLEEFLVQWLQLPLPERFHRDLPAQRQGVWRGTLLRGIVAAKQMHTITFSANSTLQFYFEIRNLVREAWRDAAPQIAHVDLWTDPRHPIFNQYPLLCTSLWPATVELASLLDSALQHRTSSELFERFVEA
jgi:hypothetical protein